MSEFNIPATCPGCAARFSVSFINWALLQACKERIQDFHSDFRCTHKKGFHA
jgi:hypothetical protein